MRSVWWKELVSQGWRALLLPRSSCFAHCLGAVWYCVVLCGQPNVASIRVVLSLYTEDTLGAVSLNVRDGDHRSGVVFVRCGP